MPEGFVSLKSWFRCEEAPVEPQREPAAESPVDGPARAPSPVEELEYEVCARVRRFGAMVDDALDHQVASLLREIAVDIIGRELQLASSDLSAIVRAARERHAFAQQPLRVRVHPSEVDRLELDVPVVGDERLRSGDAVIELRSGSIDARLGVRIEQLFERVLP